MTHETSYAIAADAVFTDLDGIEGVVVDLETKQYFTLNETASLVWRSLAAGKTVDEIAAELCARYEVSPSHAAASTRTVLAEFVARRLVILKPT